MTHTNTEALQGLLTLLRTNPALVFPRAYFKRMHLEAGAAADVRLVPTPAFQSACKGAPGRGPPALQLCMSPALPAQRCVHVHARWCVTPSLQLTRPPHLPPEPAAVRGVCSCRH